MTEIKTTNARKEAIEVARMIDLIHLEDALGTGKGIMMRKKRTIIEKKGEEVGVHT